VITVLEVGSSTAVAALDMQFMMAMVMYVLSGCGRYVLVGSSDGSGAVVVRY